MATVVAAIGLSNIRDYLNENAIEKNSCRKTLLFTNSSQIKILMQVF